VQTLPSPTLPFYRFPKNCIKPDAQKITAEG